MKKVESISELNTNLGRFEGTNYSTNSYFFGDELKNLINSESLYFDTFDPHLLIYKHVKEFNFFEVYYYIKDNDSPINIIGNGDFVMEIPYRGLKNFPSAIVDFWHKSNFITHINRDLLGLNKPDLNGFNLPHSELEFKFIEDLKSVNVIYDAIKSTFDKLTGDILSVDEISSALKNKEIIGAYKDMELAGFIRYYSKNKVSWIGHLVVFPEYTGKGIGKSLVNNYLRVRSDQGFTNFQQWVISNNDAALKLYSYFGFKSTNKSSISLIKK